MPSGLRVVGDGGAPARGASMRGKGADRERKSERASGRANGRGRTILFSGGEKVEIGGGEMELSPPSYTP